LYRVLTALVVLFSIPLAAMPRSQGGRPPAFDDLKPAAARLPRLHSLLVAVHGTLAFEY
jgi:hypothetical protein